MESSLSEDEAPVKAERPLKLTTSLLFECPFQPKSSDGDTNQDPIETQWAAFHGSKAAILGEDGQMVQIRHLDDHKSTKNTQNKDLTDADEESHNGTIRTQDPVLVMAFSTCGEFLAVADTKGVLSLYNSNGESLFAYPLVKEESVDRVVSMSFASTGKTANCDSTQELIVVTSEGNMHRLSDLRLRDLEKWACDHPLDTNSKLLRNVTVQHASVERLNERAQSCVLVHHLDSVKYVVLANHSAFFSVWEIPASDKGESVEIKKISASNVVAESGSVEAMSIDDNSGWLVILAEGKLSWWDWRGSTNLFQADISEVLNFALLSTPISNHGTQTFSSLVAISRSANDE